jgi:hypothetical protein
MNTEQKNKMRPIDFVMHDDDFADIELIREAVTKPLKIFGQLGEYEIVDYHYHEVDECMLLAIQKKA